MVKSIFKNIIILALLIIIILLLFGIFFYKNIPSNKIVPDKVEYTLPEQLKQELDVTLEEEQKEVLVTYVVKGKDISQYEGNKNYNPGKIDPFADISTVSGTNTTTGTNGNTTTNDTDNMNK